MGHRNIDQFKELGHKMETVLGGIQKSVVPCNLIRPVSFGRYNGEN